MTGQEDTKFGFSLASGAAAEAVEALRASRRVRARRGARPHRQPDLRARRFRRGDRGPRPVRGRERASPSAASAAASASPTSRARWRPRSPNGHGRCTPAAAMAGLPPEVRLTAEPGRAIVAGAAVTVVPGRARSRRSPGCAPTSPSTGACPTTRGPCSTAAATRRSCPARRARRARWPPGVVGKHCESGDVIVDDARLPSDLAVGDVLATPVTGAYGFAMASNYNRVLRPPVVFVSGGRCARRRPARDRRRPARSSRSDALRSCTLCRRGRLPDRASTGRHRVRCASAFSATATSAPPSRSSSTRKPRRSRSAPASSSRSPASPCRDLSRQRPGCGVVRRRRAAHRRRRPAS